MSSTIGQQMPLRVGFREEAVFEHYLPGENAVAIGTLRQALAKMNDHLIFILCHRMHGEGNAGNF